MIVQSPKQMGSLEADFGLVSKMIQSLWKFKLLPENSLTDIYDRLNTDP